ncbi:hypothetical protein GW17_00019583 [Ensete ventricosum]|nr:hypothetical protein GW17_00019583 [Ensete ventricosum]
MVHRYGAVNTILSTNRYNRPSHTGWQRLVFLHGRARCRLVFPHGDEGAASSSRAGTRALPRLLAWG